MNLINEIKSGKVFIYPTDTVYGLGCNALNKKAVEKIKNIKKRNKNKPLSIISPDYKWIERKCIINLDLKKYLPGPYTLILKKRDKNFLKHISKTEFLGIRIPDNEFSYKVQKSGVPFVTTSVNKSGEKPASQIKEIPEEIKSQADIIIDKGKLSGKPSTLIMGEEKIKRDR